MSVTMRKMRFDNAMYLGVTCPQADNIHSHFASPGQAQPPGGRWNRRGKRSDGIGPIGPSGATVAGVRALRDDGILGDEPGALVVSRSSADARPIGNASARHLASAARGGGVSAEDGGAGRVNPLHVSHAGGSSSHNPVVGRCPLNGFVLAGGDIDSSNGHLARAVNGSPSWVVAVLRRPGLSAAPLFLPTDSPSIRDVSCARVIAKSRRVGRAVVLFLPAVAGGAVPCAGASADAPLDRNRGRLKRTASRLPYCHVTVVANCVLEVPVTLVASVLGALGRTPQGLLPSLRPGCIGAAPSCQRHEVGQLGASRLLAISSGVPIPVAWLYYWAFGARPCTESFLPLLQGSANWLPSPSTLLPAIQRRGRSAGGAGGQIMRWKLGRPPLGRYGGCYPAPKVQGCCHCHAGLVGAPEPHAGTVRAADARTHGSGRLISSRTALRRQGSR